MEKWVVKKMIDFKTLTKKGLEDSNTNKFTFLAGQFLLGGMVILLMAIGLKYDLWYMNTINLFGNVIMNFVLAIIFFKLGYVKKVIVPKEIIKVYNVGEKIKK